MAGSVTETTLGRGNVRRLVLSCVGDSVNGSIPEVFISKKFNGRLIRLVVDPGALASPSSSASPSVSPSSSASASRSPSSSVSRSPSHTASVSPSSSTSPSVSASSSSSPSRSPSASTSPSVSASASASPSLSPSTSLSPSSSTSPSSSASPSIAAPSDNVDVQIFDEHGVDVLQGLGMNVDTAATTSVPILFAGTSVHPAIDEASALRLKIGQQFAASAQVTITLYLASGY